MKKLFTTLIAWGPLGVLLIAGLDGAGIPLPGGVDALLVGVAVENHRAAYGAACLAILGSLVGSLILFYLARKGGEAFLHRHTLSARGMRLRLWFQHYGLLTVFIPALVPIPLPLKIFIICSGALGNNPFWFTLVLAAARVIRYFGLAWLGVNLGPQTVPWLESHVITLLAGSAALFVVLFFIVSWAEKRRARIQAAEQVRAERDHGRQIPLS
ncbi:MAG TPA: VTT domain-containing protein [Bryobacteraceae bacterium]|nr:VTT domain-containing protein [Bryobacteraceae bacterium]